MEKRYQSHPDYQKALEIIAEQRSLLGKIRWTDSEYRRHMEAKNKEVSRRPTEREARRQRAMQLWSTPEYREKQRRTRFGSLNILDGLTGGQP
jgi:hypothetical protein